MSQKSTLGPLGFLNGAAIEVAPQLLGCILERRIDNQIIRVKIVETEAYDQYDMASHSYGGPTKRNQVMFGPPGTLYVYFTYGMHYCCNVVVGPGGNGAAVLIRAVEPIVGVETIEKLRLPRGVDMTNGPAKLCQGLQIDMLLNGHDLANGDLKLIRQNPLNDNEIVQTTRVGITKSTESLLRFYIKNNKYVSKY